MNDSFTEELEKLANVSLLGKGLSALGAIGGGTRGAIRGLGNIAKKKGNVGSAIAGTKGGAKSGWRSSMAYNQGAPNFMTARQKALQPRVGANQLIGGGVLGAGGLMAAKSFKKPQQQRYYR